MSWVSPEFWRERSSTVQDDCGEGGGGAGLNGKEGGDPKTFPPLDMTVGRRDGGEFRTPTKPAAKMGTLER